MESRSDIEKYKRFAERGTQLFCNMLWAFQEKELDSTSLEYIKIAMMALASDVYNQGYSEGQEAGYKDAETIKDVFG